MATLRWISGAQSVTNVWTLTLSGTVTSQTYTITIGSKTITYTADGSATQAIIFAALLASWNSTSNPAPAEFKELIATGGVTNLVLTGRVTGRPHVVAFTTGGAATATATETTAATGPNFRNNGANWTGGAAPANGDTLVYDSGNVPCKYGFTAALTTLTTKIEPGYGGYIGLPDVNTDGLPYHEYRDTSYVQEGGTLVVNSGNVSLVRVYFGTTAFTARSLQTGQRTDPNAPVVLLTGGAASSECDVSRGDVGLAVYAGETANCPTIQMSYVSQSASDARVIGGTGLTVTTITKSGGTLELNSSVTTLTQDPNGGTTTIQAGSVTTLNVNGGTVVYNSTGTLATANVRNDGVLDFNQDPRGKTITNPINAYGPNAFVKDSQKNVNSGVLSLVTVGTPLANIDHSVSNTISLT
jgi:hypothetical protein